MSESDLKNIKKIFENAKKGNKEAFSEIYEVYFEPLYRYVYLRIGNKTESDDLAQDIFIKSFSFAEKPIAQKSSFIHFYDIARKLVINWNSKRKRIISFNEITEDYSDDKTERTDENLKKEEFDNLCKAMQELSDKQQNAVIFKFIGNLSNEDIGLLLEIPSWSARHLEAQGLILIRDILKKVISGSFNQKKEFVIEEALKLKDEGKQLPHIIKEFPDYESEIREVFGIVAFIRENADKIIAPKNVLKTLLSKMPDGSSIPFSSRFKKEIAQENNVYCPITEEVKDNDALLNVEDNLIFGKWKIIITVIILSIAMGILLLRSDSGTKTEIINENIETTKNGDELNSFQNTDNISSSTEEDNN